MVNDNILIWRPIVDDSTKLAESIAWEQQKRCNLEQHGFRKQLNEGRIVRKTNRR